MFEALILIVLVGGIIILARRWPDVERRVFPDEVMADEPDTKPVSKSAAPVGTPTAKGVMHTHPVGTEPEVDDNKSASEPVEETVEVTEQVTVEETTEPGEQKTETTVTETVKVTEDRRPGGLVSGAPAKPSQPAYYDATTGDDESAALADQVDRAYRERDYPTAEQAALKLLAKDPKNHKYMTRLGQVYQEMGQLEDAKEAFEEAKKLDPKNFFVLNRLTEVERLLSDKGGRTKSKK